MLSFVEKSPCDYRIAGAAADTENGNGSHLSAAGIAQKIARKLPQTQMRISLIFFNKFKLVKCGELLENGFYSQVIYVKKTENRRFRSKTRKILRYHAGIARPAEDAPLSNSQEIIVNLWRTEVDAMQGACCDAVRALRATGNTAARRLWKPEITIIYWELLLQPMRHPAAAATAAGFIIERSIEQRKCHEGR